MCALHATKSVNMGGATAMGTLTQVMPSHDPPTRSVELASSLDI